MQKRPSKPSFAIPKDILTGTSRISATTFNAKVDSLFAFGYMALHSPDPRVRAESERFLDSASGLSAPIWREIKWESPYHATESARNSYMVGKVRLVMNELAAKRRSRARSEPNGIPTPVVRAGRE